MTTITRRGSARPLPLALTMGEPAGIGGEIALKAWLRRGDGVPPFFAVDDPARLAAASRRIGLPVPIREISAPEDAARVFAEAFPVLALTLAAPAVPGRIDPSNARAVLASIDCALDLVRQGQAAAIVTNPIHKKTLYDAGFRHPGHTEYLAERAGGDASPVMMLVGGGLRVVPVTIHVPLREAIDRLSSELIVAQGRILAKALISDCGLLRARIAVAGLNPHAGEDGALGREEIEVIAPAVERLRAEGIDAIGPLPPDTLFHAAARPRYHAWLCMYHDQALIPLKTLDFERGVNVTLGLPFVRTSPDHGTALAIAGTGQASEASLVAAIMLAGEMAARRALRSREVAV
ncbi:MAG TPA: 4-hydroxythreonine-4-phosphate dehydrogenase PdxA [Alphaproteobacteria bacterium]|nr:4-hydroxythreonine-4-phosphate dehydrogenase PdxA [Alphaproteobacteria bacterium]